MTTTCVGKAVHRSTYIAEDTSFTVKAAKMTSKIILLAKECMGTIGECWMNVSNSLKGTIEILETLNWFGAVADLISSDKEGKYFLTNSKISFAKRWERVSLFVHGTLKLIRAISVFGAVSMAFIAKVAVGQLTFFRISLDLTYLCATGGGLAETISNIQKGAAQRNRADVSEASKAIAAHEIASASMKIAIQISKIAMICLGIGLAAACCMTWPLAVTLAAGAAFADTLGFIQVYYHKIYVDEPKNKLKTAIA